MSLINKNMNKEPKIVLATRTKDKSYKNCIDVLKKLTNNPYISKFYIINDTEKTTNIMGGKEFITIKDPEQKPTRTTAFNLVLEKLRDDAKNGDKTQYHLLTYSKEVRLEDVHIEKWFKKFIRIGKVN